jgi:O-antigen/teichoic acid export membrane protein
MDLRAIVGITGSFVQLACAYFLVPRLGLLGLAIGQVIQSMVGLGLGLILLLRLVGPDLYTLTGWRKSTFFELVRYGSGFQAAAIGQILFEPAVKAILTRYSGLEFTGYYEMANRMILQLRNVLVSAYQSLVPYVASASKSELEIRSIYISSYRLLFFFLAPCVGLAGLLLPFMLRIWLGRFVTQFLEIGELCLLGWALNTLNVPAYFIFLGIGDLRWPVVSSTVIGLLAAGLGVLFGHMFGGFGVLGAVTVALAFGSHIVTYAFHDLHQIPMTWLLPHESRATAICAVMGSVIVLLLELSARSDTHIMTLVVIPIFAATLIYLSLKNPNVKVLVKLIGELRRRPNGDSVS